MPGRDDALVEAWRAQFPALRQEIDGHPLLYLDTAATALRPVEVDATVSEFSLLESANPGAELHALARRSAARYDDARRTVAGFLHAPDPAEIVFTRGTTDAINLVAAAWGGAHLRPGDEILIGIAEHSSNMVPWLLIARRTGAEVRTFGVDEQGHPLEEDFLEKLTPRTRIVAFSHVSNVLGIVNPVARMCAAARAPDRIVVIDAAQSVPHIPVDVRALGCDFLAFSSHKMLGPMGVGVLWGRRELLDAMPPYQGGSNMAHDVELDAIPLASGALRFGAGTPNVSGAVGLAAAIRWLESAGREAICRHERALVSRMLERLGAMRGVRVLGSADAGERIAVFSFTVDGMLPRDVMRRLDERGIAIRAGDLASLPLLRRFGATRAARASCWLYTTLAEVDRFADALEEITSSRRTT